MIPVMNHGNVTLRAPEPDDTELLYQWENNSDIWRVSNTLAPFSRHAIRKHIEESTANIYESGQARFIICRSDDMKPVGAIDLFEFDSFHLRAGVGILIADKDDRRRGYALNAITALTEYCFNHLMMHQLWCNILPANEGSTALFEKAGFVLSGIKKEWVKEKDGFSDELFYQLINPSV